MSSDHPTSPLQIPRFLRFWCGRISAATGNQMLMVAMGWQMYTLTGSAWDLGLVGLAQFLPALVLTLPAGHAADRGNRGLILVLCMVVETIIGGVLATAAFGGWADRSLLLAMSVALGAVKGFQNPAQQSMVALLVPDRLISRATAVSSMGMKAAVIVGPALGGAIYIAGEAVVYGVCTALFVLAGVVFLALRSVHVPPPKEEVTLATVFAGFRFVWNHKPVLGAISLDLFAVLLGGATALLPMFAKDILHVGPTGLGLLRAAPAVGALLMSAVLTRWPVERKVGRRMFEAIAVYGLATLVFGLSTSFALSIIALMVTGAADMVNVVIRMSMVQLDTPNEMRGRVSAVNAICIGASNELGQFVSGATAEWLGPVGSLVLGGVGTLVIVALWIVWFPALAKRDRLQLRN